MKPLTVADCLWGKVHAVAEEDRPSRRPEGWIFAVFADIHCRDTFRGLVTDRQVANHPDWIFADLVEHGSLPRVTPATPLRAVLELLWKSKLEAVPVVDEKGRFVGAVTHASLIGGLLAQERKLLREARHFRAVAKAERRQLAAWSSRLSELHEASSSLLSVLADNPLQTDLLTTAIQSLTHLLQARYGAIGIFDTQSEMSLFVYSGITGEQARLIGRPPEGRGLLGLVTSNNMALRLDDMTEHPHSTGFPAHHPPMKSLLAVPVSHAGRIYGRIYLCDKRNDMAFTAEDELLAKNFAHSLSLVLDNAREMEELKNIQRRLDYLAHFDPLTNLPNRALARDRIQQALARAHHHGQLVAILFLDLDHFKHINDSYGHTIGDQLLQAVVKRLQGCLRESDTLARLSGDEFVILLPDTKEVCDAATVAQKMLDTLSAAFQLESLETFISASIGISIFPNDATDIENLLRTADTAMYQAKAGGRNTYRFFTAEMNRSAQRRVQIEHALRLALARDELSLHYQPQVGLFDCRVVGVEALLRWKHPELGWVSPAEFIPLAEESGLIVPIGEWVLQTACAQAKTWVDRGFDTLRVAVNLSARQFKNKDFVIALTRILAETGLPPHLLELEITESTLMHDTDVIIATLSELQSMGVRFSIDDFGTGYSSLSYLKRIPIHMLKIDQSFVRDIDSDPNDAAIINAIIAMAHRLNLSVIAEGVETVAQLEQLRALGCDRAQGYYFGRPVPAAQIHPDYGSPCTDSKVDSGH